MKGWREGLTVSLLIGKLACGAIALIHLAEQRDDDGDGVPDAFQASTE